MKPDKSDRNKTICLTEGEIEAYAKSCIDARSYAPPGSGVVHGDAFEAFCRLPGGFVDLMVVDPPYNLGKVYGESAFKKMGDAQYADFTKRWIEAALPCLKPGATIYVCSDWRTSLVVAGVLGEYFTVQNRITWQREKGRGALRNWKNSMEDIWYATLSPNEYTFNVETVKMRRRVVAPYRVGGKPKDWTEGAGGNFRDTFPSNFWDDISIPYWSMPENTDHPAQKPEKLIAKLILASSNKGDMVFDPFAGSGTTAVVAKKLGRRYLVIEREALYCAYAQKRLEMAENTPAIQGYEDGVFWERNTLLHQMKHKGGSRDLQQTLPI